MESNKATTKISKDTEKREQESKEFFEPFLLPPATTIPNAPHGARPQRRIDALRPIESERNPNDPTIHGNCKENKGNTGNKGGASR